MIKKRTEFTEEHRRKISESRKAYFENDEASQVHKRKMSEGMKAFWDNIRRLKEENENKNN